MYEGLKGFRETYSEEMVSRRWMFDTIEQTAHRYGFREIDTPALERTQMYIDKSGEDIVEELYTFADKGGRDIALTPELTPTVARMVADRGKALSKPIKWYSTRKFWRYEQVQQGRFREFYQTNVDILGSKEPVADAEILAVAADMLRELGLEADDFEFRVSHRDILGGLIEAFDTTVESRDAIRTVDKKATLDREEYLTQLTDAGLSHEQAKQFDSLLDTPEDELDELITFADSDRVEAAVHNLQAVLAATADRGIRKYCTLSLETARGLDYYTGTVFECFDSTGEVSRAVFGGGRYDNLIEDLGGPSIPAVGVAPGGATLSLLCQRAGVWPDEGITTDYYVLQIGDTRPVAARIARQLRELGHTVESDVSDRGFSGQLSYADSINAETVVVVGEQDLADDAVTIKDMESGDQTQVPLDEFPPEHGRPTYEDFS